MILKLSYTAIFMMLQTEYRCLLEGALFKEQTLARIAQLRLKCGVTEQQHFQAYYI